jgi:hypothetical protein
MSEMGMLQQFEVPQRPPHPTLAEEEIQKTICLECGDAIEKRHDYQADRIPTFTNIGPGVVLGDKDDATKEENGSKAHHYPDH